MSDFSKEAIEEVLTEIEDPELHIDIFNLGLIYDIRINDLDNGKKFVEVDMTLTSPGCPIGPSLQAAVHHKILTFEEVEDVKVNLVFSPPWDARKHASEEAQMELNIF